MIVALLAVLVVPANGHAVWHANTPSRRDVQIDEVTANRDRLVFGDQMTSDVGAMYGDGLAIRLVARHGHRFTIRAASVNTRRVKLRVHYHLLPKSGPERETPPGSLRGAS